MGGLIVSYITDLFRKVRYNPLMKTNAKSTSFRLLVETIRQIKMLAATLKLSQVKVVELAVRELANKTGVVPEKEDS